MCLCLGLSGLTTAAMLARQGKKVVVLEQHDIAGGCTHTFESGGYEFDTGVHYVGGNVINPKSMLGFLFSVLSLGQLKWNKLDRCYDEARISDLLAAQRGACIEMNGPRHFQVLEENESGGNLSGFEDFLRAFPGEEDALLQYKRLVGWAEIAVSVHSALKLLPLWMANMARKCLAPYLDPLLGSTTDEVLSSFVRNRTLRGALSYCWGDYVRTVVDMRNVNM